MKILKSLLRHEAATPLLALVFASGVSVALVATRVALTHRLQYAVLIWNLFLAWLPLLFALGARSLFRSSPSHSWRLYTLAAAWLLFFPNAPYIFTDLIHLRTGYFQHYWIDLMLVLVVALTGLILGFVSLYLMQSVVARIYGVVTSWLFVAATVGLSSVGIYLGRFLRFNSWDVLQPTRMFQTFGAWRGTPWINGHSATFLALFAIFLFLAYVMLYALTHLPRNLQFSTAETLE